MMKCFRAIAREAVRLGPICIAVGALFVMFAGAGLAAGDPAAISVAGRLRPPSDASLMGTDALGRDLASRVALGARRTALSALGAVAVAAALGAPLGLSAARKPTSGLLAGLLTSMIAFPGFLLVLLFAATFGPSSASITAALGIAAVPGTGRFVYDRARSVLSRPCVAAAVSCGAHPRWRWTRHVDPRRLPAFTVFLSGRVGTMILVVGALSFLGFGAQPPVPELGAVLAENRLHAAGAPWLVIFPGVALTLSSLAFHLLGDALHRLLERY